MALEQEMESSRRGERDNTQTFVGRESEIELMNDVGQTK